MTNNQLTKEWLQQTIAELESVRDEIPFGIDTNSELELAAFKLALAAMDNETVGNEFIPKNLDKALGVVGMAPPESKEEFNFQIERWVQRLIDRVIRYADEFQEQPATVVPEEMPCGGAADDYHDGYQDGWNACRAAMLQPGNCRENANSSTNNFREITETSTRTAITPAAPDKKLTDDVLDEIIAGAKTSMEQYLALSLKAEREVWRKEGPTDDERIMAIEGINNCERCGDEGWIVGEMGITRCACSQDGTLTSEDTKQFEPVTTANKLGNSPVIPDGYVMVPKDPTAEMQSAGASAISIETTALNKLWTGNAVFRAMLAAAPQEVSHD